MTEGQEVTVDQEKSVTKFRALVEREEQALLSSCEVWEAKLKHDGVTDLPEEVQGLVRSVVGQGKLVMAERFVQFRGLIDNCEEGLGEKKVTLLDLHGFWEMIYLQVKDVNSKFLDLSKLEANHWKRPVQVETVRIIKESGGERKKKRSGGGGKTSASPGLKALIASRRKLVTEGLEKEVKASMEGSGESSSPETGHSLLEMKPATTFHGGFFSLFSPAREVITKAKKSSPLLATRSVGRVHKSGRKTITESARRTASLVSPCVSHLAKLAINRKDGNITAKRSSLFDGLDDDDDQTAAAACEWKQ